MAIANSRKRHRPWQPSLSLDPHRGREPLEKRPRRMSANEQKEVVGKLQGEINGEAYSIYITLANVFWMGRHPSCDLVIDSPEVSNFHLRIYAVRTATELSVTCVHDVSTNGFLHNDHLYSPSNEIEISHRRFSHRSVVLRPGDTIRIPGSPTVWTYVHNNRHHLASTLRPVENPTHTSVLPLFDSSSPDQEITRGPWKIHNYALGTGTYGVVHLASHSAGGLQVACKTIARAKSRGVQDALRKEVEVMRSLHHPNVLAILDMVEDEHRPGEDDETPTPDPDGDDGEDGAPKYRPRMHLFLELVTGGDLFSYVDKYKSLTEDEVKWIAYQLIEGLKYIHGKDIVHRDIKPENILLYSSEAYPRIVIADFGMAITYDELLAGVPEHRHQGAERHFPNCGTTSFLPPERLRAMSRRPIALKGIGESLRGTGEARRRQLARTWFEEEAQLDIYGAGLVLYICASGQHPYATEQDPDAEGEEVEEVAATSAAPAGFHPIEEWHHQKGRQSWDTFRAATALREENEPDEKVKKECRKYLQLSLDFSKIPVERWPQANWRNYSTNDILRRFLAPTPSARPSWNKVFLHGWWKHDLEYAKLLFQKIVIQGRARIPLFADTTVASQRPSQQKGVPVTYGNKNGKTNQSANGKDKGKGKGKVAKPPNQESLFLTTSTQGSQPSQVYEDPIETGFSQPIVRNGFAGRGRRPVIDDPMEEDDFELIREYSASTTSTPSTCTALENERKGSTIPSLGDLMRYGSKPVGSHGGGVGRAGPGPRTTIYRRNSSLQIYKSQRSQSLMDRIHEDDEDGDDEMDRGERSGEEQMSVG